MLLVHVRQHTTQRQEARHGAKGTVNRPTECPVCHAERDAVVLRRQTDAAGRAMIAWYCKSHAGWAGRTPKWLPHDNLAAYLTPKGKSIADVPLLTDHEAQNPPCVICSKTPSQYHHWLPRMFFEHPEIIQQVMAWDRLGGYLCQYHHDLWHDLVTPAMPGRGASRRQEPDHAGSVRADL